MNGFTLGLLDRLFGEGASGAANGVLLRVLIEQIKGALACNLEALPNIKAGVTPALLAIY